MKEKSEQSEMMAKKRTIWGKKSRFVRDRIKRQQGNYLREDRLKWTKRDYEGRRVSQRYLLGCLMS